MNDTETLETVTKLFKLKKDLFDLLLDECIVKVIQISNKYILNIENWIYKLPEKSLDKTFREFFDEYTKMNKDLYMETRKSLIKVGKTVKCQGIIKVQTPIDRIKTTC